MAFRRQRRKKKEKRKIPSGKWDLTSKAPFNNLLRCVKAKLKLEGAVPRLKLLRPNLIQFAHELLNHRTYHADDFVLAPVVGMIVH
jgi:hypothetical protein